QRRRVVLARRAEQFGAGAVVRGSQDHHQLGRLVRHQLVVGVRVGGGAAARIYMRRDQARQRRGFFLRGGAAGSFGWIEERRELETQLCRVFFVAEARQRCRAVGAGKEFFAHAPLAVVKRGRVEKVRAIQRRDQFVQLVERN